MKKEYFMDFRKGTVNSDLSKKVQAFNNIFSELNLNKNDFLENRNLPGNSILVDKTLYIYSYEKDSRNMMFESKILEIFTLQKSDIKIVFVCKFEDSYKIPDSVLIDINMLKELACDFIGLTRKQQESVESFHITNDLDLLQKRTRKEGEEADVLSIKCSNDKNIQRGFMFMKFSRKKGYGWRYEFEGPISQKVIKFQELIASEIINAHTMGETNVFDYIKKMNASSIEFDNVVVTRKVNDREINISRRDDLYDNHNKLMVKACDEYMKSGFSIVTEKFGIDILARKGSDYIITEIKGTPSKDNFFKSIGQLLFYRERFSESFSIDANNIKMVFISSDEPREDFKKMFSKLEISWKVVSL